MVGNDGGRPIGTGADGRDGVSDVPTLCSFLGGRPVGIDGAPKLVLFEFELFDAETCLSFGIPAAKMSPN